MGEGEKTDTGSHSKAGGAEMLARKPQYSSFRQYLHVSTFCLRDTTEHDCM